MALLTGGGDERYVLASDAAYGFIARLADLQGRHKAGKAVLTLPKGARVMPPARLPAPPEDCEIAVVSNTGRLLVLPATELPTLGRGKGVKLMGIPPARVAEREEFLAALAVVQKDGRLVVQAGQRQMRLDDRDLEAYRGTRGRRGALLPQGFRKVATLSAGD